MQATHALSAELSKGTANSNKLRDGNILTVSEALNVFILICCSFVVFTDIGIIVIGET